MIAGFPVVKWIRTLHLYLGCLFAPMLIFFCATGAWQLFGFHRGTKDGSYVPPDGLQTLSMAHQYQNLDGFGHQTSLLFRWFALALALGIIATTVLGLIMAFKRRRGRWLAVGVTLVGLVVPALFLWLAGR